MLFFSNRIEIIMQHKFWDYSSAYLISFYGFSTFIVISIFYFLANIRFIDRLIIPKKIRNKKVKERAIRHFMESGAYNTKERSGILIFISFLERRVELLADIGISKKIPQEKWDSIVQYIVNGIKENKISEHLSKAIEDCGKLLAIHFPIQPDDVNELKDDIDILEK
ncbi:MAG: TPM domain-containing protein [Bacteroidetes bacterium]|nr:MAG: TPM domain-containing protein [Bacteroidota bacterium]